MARAEYINRILRLMGEKGLSQDEFGTSIGLNRDRVNNWLNGRSKLDIDSLKTISEKYAVSTDWLLGLSDIQTPDKSIQGVVNTTGLSERAIKNICDFFKVSVSDEVEDEIHVDATSDLSPLLESDDFIRIVASLQDFCFIRNLCAGLMSKITGVEYDRADVFFDQSDEIVLEDFFPDDKKDEFTEIAIENFKKYYVDLRMQSLEVSEMWSDFVNSFVSLKDVMSDSKKLYDEIVYGW